jgi:surfactin synthase thioesterase subunit
MRALFVPPTLADYRAVETYRHVPGRDLGCPVTVLVGDRDPHTTVEEARAWAGHTTAETSLHVFPGGHFYLDDHWAEVAAAVRAALAADVNGDPAPARA